MTMLKTNLRTQLAAFAEGKYLDGEGKESWCYNFWDWFCKDELLKAKSDRLFKFTKKLVKILNIDLDKHYVWFKNNCPVRGPLYDDLRICDIETGDVIWNFAPKSGHSGLAEIYFKDTGWNTPYLEAKGITEFFKLLKLKTF